MARDQELDCTDPSQLLDQYPCLKCMSIQELYVILTGMFFVANANQLDPLSIVENGAKFRNLSQKEFLQALIASLPAAWFVTLTPENLEHDFGCLKCVPLQQLKGLFLNQWCQYWATNVLPP